VRASRSEFASISVAGLEVRASRKVWAWLPTTLADVSPMMHLAQHDEHSGPVEASASRSRASAVVNLLYDTPDERCQVSRRIPVLVRLASLAAARL
jgi:hypothetical protein